jgi:cell division transport system ATP-binding protein
VNIGNGRNRSDIKNKVMAILGQVGLAEKAHLKPHRLSGGDQQRAALARALVNEPRILLADEPTGNLDDSTKDQIMALLEQVNLKGTTVMVATHDQRLLERNTRRIITLPPPALQRSETSTTVNSSEVSHEQ